MSGIPKPRPLRLPPRRPEAAQARPVSTGLLYLRGVLFAILFNLTLLIQGLMGLPLLLLPIRVAEPYAQSWLSLQFWLLRVICRLDFRVIGAENIPEQVVIFASKHQSAWETFVFLYLARNPAYILKKELFWLPIYGWWGMKLGMIGVDRAGHASALRRLLGDSRSALESGRHLVIFPQGTRTAAGSGKPYQPGIYAIYRDSQVPVVPVALDSGRFWPKRSLLRYPGCITLSFLPVIPPGLSRAEFMLRLEQAIETESLRLSAPG
ncbi:MAG: lysophospholipid acyltransferase family protein [Alphaproteobacteria bacterium]|nr:lysophospholipid acyltransferase family protein [Alphaproteobacteria bacterium]